ncbi:hypothetical protein PtB15_7B287 [Puccinia triticina]|nr:hypothetical protein PtB15_7B287 [Puccinia triticina]
MAVPATAIEDNIQDTFPIIAPPPEQTCQSKEELKESIQNWAFHHGFAIATANSAFSQGKMKITFQCDCSGKYRGHRANVPAKAQTMSSTKISCPFRLTATLESSGLWALKVKNPQHNHGPSDTPLHQRSGLGDIKRTTKTKVQIDTSEDKSTSESTDYGSDASLTDLDNLITKQATTIKKEVSPAPIEKDGSPVPFKGNPDIQPYTGELFQPQ